MDRFLFFLSSHQHWLDYSSIPTFIFPSFSTTLYTILILAMAFFWLWCCFLVLLVLLS